MFSNIIFSENHGIAKYISHQTTQQITSSSEVEDRNCQQFTCMWSCKVWQLLPLLMSVSRGRHHLCAPGMSFLEEETKKWEKTLYSRTQVGSVSVRADTTGTGTPLLWEGLRKWETLHSSGCQWAWEIHPKSHSLAGFLLVPRGWHLDSWGEGHWGWCHVTQGVLPLCRKGHTGTRDQQQLCLCFCLLWKME